MRYKIVKGSESGHCCFEYSVIDTLNYKMLSGVKCYETVCECFEREYAEKIVNALNKGEA